jgi:hypothetical protein
MYIRPVEYNKVSKFGLILLFIGMACTLFAEYMLHERLMFVLSFENKGLSTESDFLFINAMKAGL